jgi:hypothetical protein
MVDALGIFGPACVHVKFGLQIVVVVVVVAVVEVSERLGYY